MSALPKRDRELVQIVDAAMADAARRSGSWLVCRPGCTQCCTGVFAISALDSLRLQHGLEELEQSAPSRAARVLDRAHESATRLASSFPGDPKTGTLFADPKSQQAFEDFANDEVCPALDPETGLCDLYDSRPITCRAFGPPIQTGEGLGHCELCYQGASDQEIARCEMKVDPDNLEHQLLEELGSGDQTVVTFALVTARSRFEK